MLYPLALILILSWLLGIVSSYTIGGFIHVLLLIGVILILIGLSQSRRV